jgi:hypothetical protein
MGRTAWAAVPPPADVSARPRSRHLLALLTCAPPKVKLPVRPAEEETPSYRLCATPKKYGSLAIQRRNSSYAASDSMRLVRGIELPFDDVSLVSTILRSGLTTTVIRAPGLSAARLGSHNGAPVRKITMPQCSARPVPSVSQ